MLIFGIIMVYLVIGVMFLMLSGAIVYSDGPIALTIILIWPYFILKLLMKWMFDIR